MKYPTVQLTNLQELEVKKFIDMIIQDTQLPAYSKVQVFTVFFCHLEKTF